jgi:hypothetical protein
MKRLEIKMPNDFNLFLGGDQHIGSRFRSKSDWKKTKRMLRKPYEGCKNNYWLDHGDILEGIMIDDPRFDPLTHEDSVLDQIDHAIKEYQDISDIILVMLDGNHPKSRGLKKFGEITKKICKELNVPFGTWSAHITYTDKKGVPMFKHFMTHGKASITSALPDPFQRRLALERKLRAVLRAKFGDTQLMSRGHTHKVISSGPDKTRDLYLYMDGGINQGYANENSHQFYIPPEQRFYASTGSFFKLYGEDGEVSYAEEQDYDPIELGFCVAKIRDKRIVGIDEVIL